MPGPVPAIFLSHRCESPVKSTNEVGRYNITWLFKMAEGAELDFAKTKKSKSYHLDLERPASKIMTIGNKCFRFVLTNFPNITRWKRNGVEVPHRSNRLQKTPSMYASIGWRLAKITCNFRQWANWARSAIKIAKCIAVFKLEVYVNYNWKIFVLLLRNERTIEVLVILCAWGNFCFLKAALLSNFPFCCQLVLFK